jgi:hypothetical protein
MPTMEIAPEKKPISEAKARWDFALSSSGFEFQTKNENRPKAKTKIPFKLM